MARLSDAGCSAAGLKSIAVAQKLWRTGSRGFLIFEGTALHLPLELGFGVLFCYSVCVRTKTIISGAIALVLVLFIAVLFIPRRNSAQNISVRHVRSVQWDNVTRMTFEIKNHNAVPYLYFPSEVQVRKSNVWTRFQSFDARKFRPIPMLDAKGVVFCTVDVTNLPAGSVVRFTISAQKKLLGVEGFAIRAKLNLRHTGGTGGPGLSLNPNDKNSSVFGPPKEVVGEEWVEEQSMDFSPRMHINARRL